MSFGVICRLGNTSTESRSAIALGGDRYGNNTDCGDYRFVIVGESRVVGVIPPPAWRKDNPRR